MRYLSHYTEDKQSELFDKMGAFFAFGDKQYKEAKKEGIKYVSLMMGLICPQDNAKELLKGLAKVQDEGMAQDVKENGIKGIIHRELGNHEASYTYSIEDTVDALACYGITREQVQAEFRAYLKAYEEWEAEHG